MIDTKTNAGAAFAMDVADFCFRQMAKVCLVLALPSRVSSVPSISVAVSIHNVPHTVPEGHRVRL